MLARLVRELPEGDFVYEPKWAGFRCLAFRDGAAVDLRSRHGRPLGRYFPELTDALAELRASSASVVTPATDDHAVAAGWLVEFRGGGLDGVVAKPRAGRYEGGVR